MEHTPAFIGGDAVSTADTYDNIDPSTGQVLSTVSRCGAAEVERAVSAAEAARPAWERRPAVERGRVLTRLAELILEHTDTLAMIESEDTGKPLSQATNDVTVCARYFEFYGHAIDTYYGDQIPLNNESLVYTKRVPFGVAGHIFAWNYPLQIMARAVAPALATGNASVAKPADETPRSAVYVARLAIEAGLPAGLFNVITGLGVEAGSAITAHPRIAHLSFVGSTDVGKQIAHAAAERVAPTILELGGKSAQIVFSDADVDKASQAVARAILQNAGQTCSAGSRLLVERSIQDEVVNRVLERFRETTVGPGVLDCDLGPLVSQKQLERVRAFLGELPEDDVIVSGRLADSAGSGGAFQPPVLVNNVDPASRIAREEVFGPVLAVIPFDSEEEAVQIANSTDYALLGSVWTGDFARAQRVVNDVQAGQVYVNTYGAGGGVELPFGGFKLSGYGREKGYEALDSFTATKTVVVSLA